VPFVRVGWAVGPHGVKGHLRFALTTDHPEWLAGRAGYLLTDPRSGESLALTPVETRILPDGFLMRFAEFDAPEPLAALKGWELGYCARRGELPRDEPDDVYLFELPGMELRRPDGTRLGRVSDVRDNGPHTVLELDGPGRPLVPFTREACPEIRIEEGVIICTYPLG
jgi:16S rRNA processing protein RimM